MKYQKATSLYRSIRGHQLADQQCILMDQTKYLRGGKNPQMRTTGHGRTTADFPDIVGALLGLTMDNPTFMKMNELNAADQIREGRKGLEEFSHTSRDFSFNLPSGLINTLAIWLIKEKKKKKIEWNKLNCLLQRSVLRRIVALEPKQFCQPILKSSF